MSEPRDPDLYTGAAPYYSVGRVAYPTELADRIATEAGLDGTGRLLDVGCGPGSLTLLLAGHFDAAVGVDADAGMLAEAERLARAAGVRNVSWRRLYAEDLPADLGTFRMIVFAQSFHWMDRPRVARTAYGMLRPGGVCVHVHATTHRGIETDAELPLPSPPYEALAALSRRYLGAGPGRGHGPDGESAIYRAAGLSGPTPITVPRPVVTRTVEEIIAAHLSLSSSTPHLYGDRLEEFVAEARALLHAASRAGEFSEQLREVAADLWWR